MIQFEKPINLNGAELIAELNDAGIIVGRDPFIDGNDNFWLDISKKDAEKAKPIVAAHNGTQIAPEPTLEEKLANLGLNIEDLKAALAK